MLLAGGSGLADGFFALARGFMERYSLVVFNYPMDFNGNEATADAIAALLEKLKVDNVYLWGQSYGGLLAQIIAVRHPETVKGLILTSTASLSNDIRFEGMKKWDQMINENKEKKNLRIDKMLPMGLLPGLMNIVFKRQFKDDRNIQQAVKILLAQIRPDMTNAYFAHMDQLLGDLRNQLGTHRPEDFLFLRGHVLIIEPDDDTTFTDDIKQALFRIMPDPVIIREIEGGHLAIMLKPDAFLKKIHDFMDSQELKRTL